MPLLNLSDYCTWAIVVFILLFAFSMFVRSIQKFSRARKKLYGLTKELEYDHLALNNDGSPLLFRGKKILTVDPYDLILQKDYLNVAPLFVSGILTGIGILGTFLGVSLALRAFPAEISNSTVMFKSVSELIPAMKTAFYTSLAGISCATAFVGIEKLFVSRIKSICQQVLDKIQESYIVESAELYLRSQSSSQGASDKMVEAAESIKSTMVSLEAASSQEKIAELIRDGLDGSIQTHLKGPLDLIGRRLEVLEDVKKASQDLQANNETLAKFIMHDLQGIFGGLKESLDSTQEAMKQTNTALLATNENLNQQKENLSSFVAELKDVLATQRETFQEVSGQIKVGFEETSEKVFEQYNRFNQDMTSMGESVKGLSEEFQSIIKLGRDAFSEEVNGFKLMLEDQRDMTSKTFDDIRWLNRDSLEQIVATTNDTLVNAINQTRDSAIGLIDSARDSFVNVVSETNQKLQETLGGVSDELVKTSERVQEELGKFRTDYTAALQSFFDQQRDVLEEALGSHVKALSDLVGELKSVFQTEYETKKDLIDRLEKAVVRGSALSEMQKESIRELAETTVDSNQQISKSLGTTSRNLEGINESLKDIAEAISLEVAKQIEDFGKNQREVIEKYQGEVDRHLRKVLEELVAVSETLAAAALATDEVV